MSRVELAKIRSLTFYKDSRTTARRTSPLPQLICRGAPCKLYTPEVVRCESFPGGSGTDVDWKCEADLPESLRFGKVEVSCEGWSGPGDPYVLKGSCSLEYRLVHVPGALRDKDVPSLQNYDVPTLIFWFIWLLFLAVILYSFLRSCFGRGRHNETPRPPSPPRRGNSSGWFPGGMDDSSYGPPPPYSKHPTEGTNQGQGWRPGFWTGAAVGGLLNHLYNRRQQTEPRVMAYDWERERTPRASLFGFQPTYPTRADTYEDRGEGPSNLGAMRRSTGIGSSNVR